MMSDYEELLQRAYDKLPKQGSDGQRFEIPQAVVANSGNMTIIKNFSEIAKTIRRDPRHLSKFLFKELAVPGNTEDNKLVLQKKLSQAVVDDKIMLYAKEFVFCKQCGKPDTKMLLDGRKYFIKCEACGARRYC